MNRTANPQPFIFILVFMNVNEKVIAISLSWVGFLNAMYNTFSLNSENVFHDQHHALSMRSKWRGNRKLSFSKVGIGSGDKRGKR
jgi:hypothetical protein